VTQPARELTQPAREPDGALCGAPTSRRVDVLGELAAQRAGALCGRALDGVHRTMDALCACGAWHFLYGVDALCACGAWHFLYGVDALCACGAWDYTLAVHGSLPPRVCGVPCERAARVLRRRGARVCEWGGGVCVELVRLAVEPAQGAELRQGFCLLGGEEFRATPCERHAASVGGWHVLAACEERMAMGSGA